MPLQIVRSRIGPCAAEGSDEEEEEALGSDERERDRKLEDLFVQTMDRQQANAALWKTMQPVEEIKLYRIVDGPRGLRGVEEAGGRAASLGKKRSLVGGEQLKQLQFEDETRMDTRMVMKRIQNSVDKEFTGHQQRLDGQLSSMRLAARQNKLHRLSTDPNSTDNQRRQLLKTSNDRCALLAAQPGRFAQFVQPRSQLAQAEWVLQQTAKVDVGELEQDLVRLEADARAALCEDPATDSSDEDDELGGRQGRNKGLEFNMLDTDVTAKLRKDLDKLDRQLHKDMLRRMHDRVGSGGGTRGSTARRAVLPTALSAALAQTPPTSQPQPQSHVPRGRKASAATLRMGQRRLDMVRKQTLVPTPGAALNLVPAKPRRPVAPRTTVPTQPASASPRAPVPPQTPPPSSAHRRATRPAGTPSAGPLASPPSSPAPSLLLRSLRPFASSSSARGSGSDDEAAGGSAGDCASQRSSPAPEVGAATGVTTDASSPSADGGQAERRLRMDVVARVLLEVHRQHRRLSVAAQNAIHENERVLGDPFGHHNAAREPSTLYFSSPIHTIARKDHVTDMTEFARPMPYRDRERRQLAQQCARPHALRPCGEVVGSLAATGIYDDLVAQARHVETADQAVVITRHARAVIEKDMVMVRDVCHKVSAESCEGAGRLVQLCGSSVADKERMGQAVVAQLREHEFLLPAELRVRRQQFAAFDGQQAQLLDRAAGPTRALASALGCPVLPAEERSPSAAMAFLTQLHAEEAHSRSSSPASSPSRTRRRGQGQGSRGGDGTRRRELSLLLRREEGRAFQEHLQRRDLVVHNDFKLLHDYSGHVAAVKRQLLRGRQRAERARVLGKEWFLQLLHRVQTYKKSASHARVPPSLVLLLSALKRLIMLDVAVTADCAWLLIDSTIAPHEHKSNLVYLALQFLFEVVGLSSEDVYQQLRARGIEAAPKLLVDVRKARKARYLSAAIRVKEQGVGAAEKRALRLQAKVVSAFLSGLRDKRERGVAKGLGPQGVGGASSEGRIDAGEEVQSSDSEDVEGEDQEDAGEVEDEAFDRDLDLDKLDVEAFLA